MGLLVNDRVTCGQNCWERRAGRKGSGPVRVLVIFARVDNHNREAILLAENEMPAMAGSEEAEIVSAGDLDAFRGAFVENVAVNALPASE